ncbi:unnamed protein product [Prunus armeniaca]
MEREQQTSDNIQLPAGFRFHPSDEELIVHYLKNKVTSSPLPATIITELDLYKYNPWELPAKASFGEEEWYFFTPRDRKYPNGSRPNRAAGLGYWKATGTDKHIFSSCGTKSIGVKKALVFYTGHPPKGVKTEWIMNEYRLLDTTMWSSKQKGSMRLDDWVLCRVRQKCNSSRSIWEDQTSPPSYKLGAYTKQADETCSKDTNPSIEMGSGDTNSCTTILENDSSNKNNGQLLASSLESFINPFKRKPAAEGNGHHQSFVTPSKRICSREYQEEVSTLIGRDGCAMNSWGVDQSGSAENNFNADQWSSMIQYQELSQLIGFQCK